MKIGKELLYFYTFSRKKYSIQKGLEALALDLLDKYLKQQFQRVKDFGKHNKNINDRLGRKFSEYVNKGCDVIIIEDIINEMDQLLGKCDLSSLTRRY